MNFLKAKRIISFSILFFSLFCHNIYSLTINGVVFSLDKSGKKYVLPGANVYFSDMESNTTTDSDGKFSLKNENGKDTYLVVKYTGYAPDSILVGNKDENRLLEIVLKEGTQLSDVVITTNQQGTLISGITPLKTETITKSGLMKMACCNLSESFENSATVTVGFTDAVSGARQVQLLGLSGIYCQMLEENVPTLRGLASTFGWSYIPSSWLESIQISKGASSVVNGYESITGQINLEAKKPNYTDPLFINLYSDSFGRYEGNLTAATKVAKDLWSSLLLHASTESESHDYNGDGFLDMPKTKLINVYNRWFYLNENGVQSRTGFKYLYETREGGQHMPHETNQNEAIARYSTEIGNKDFTVYNKTGFKVGEKEGQSIGIINNFTHHEQNSELGLKTFTGTQNSFYSNILFTSHIGSSDKHKYTTGASFIFDNFETGYEDNLPFNQTPLTKLNKKEIVPGVFGEYTYSVGKLTLILGARTDYNSKYGWLFTPRTNIKYNISKDVIFRASAGKGFRSPNVISDNIGLLASSRKLHVGNIDSLDIENAWNYGGNLTIYIPIWDSRKATLSLDYFHTKFINQAVIDIERDRNSVYFYNLEGPSFSDALQADISLSPLNGFDIFAAFRYNKAMTTYTENGQEYELEKPLTSRYRGLINISYATKFKKWVFDATAQINGPARIPCMDGYSSPLKYSPVFPVYYAQVTKNSKRFDVYAGAENILGYRQNNPILNADYPFSKDFDSSMIWGPLMGRKIYIGTRIRIGKLQ